LAIHSFNPLKDSRWGPFVQTHANASIFHTPGWLEALRVTYGYEPVVFTTSPPETDLMNGVVFCRISSWLTGRRMVSLPFADHCDPLVDNAEDRTEIFNFLRCATKTENWRYIELRPRSSQVLAEISSEEKRSAFCLHVLDLRSSLNSLFRGFQKSSIQRVIRRAERQGLSCEQGRSKAVLDKFFGLMLKTRRRHKLPPQPISWFRNLIAFLGDRLSIRLALKDGEPVAGILTLTHKNTLVYKYGCSDAAHHRLGAVPLLFWEVIQEAKRDGLEKFDLGRSDIGNSGLITFKNRWGAEASTLEYVRFSASRPAHALDHHGMQMAKKLFARMPEGLLTVAGKLLYRHIG
jgi:GNAT acetyltransferase-like protein